MESWKKCSSCKKPIPFLKNYWVCNVSTCNRKRTGLVFCEVSCWDAHLPMMNHREAWAEERSAPSRIEWEKQVIEDAAPKKRVRQTVEVKEVEQKVPVSNPAPILRRRPVS